MVVYFVGAFLVCFFSWKKWGEEFNDYGNYDVWVERKEFWYILLCTLFYPIAIPSIIAWYVLERITNRFYK